MAIYSYKAKTMDGEVISGKMDASSENMVISHIHEKGSFPLEINVTSSTEDEKASFGNKRVSLKELTVFSRQFYSMVNAGVSIVVSMDLLRKQTDNPILTKAITKIHDNVQRGTSLSESMRQCGKVFPVIVYSMIEIGEMSGDLDVALERLTIYLEKERKITEKIKTAMAYPAIIGGIASLLVIFMLTFVAPRFIEMFKNSGKALPMPTQVLVSIGDLFKNGYFLVGVALAIFGIRFLIKKLKEHEKVRYALDNFMLGLPLIGNNIKKILASRFSRALCILLQSGVPIVKSLEVIDRLLDNSVMARAMNTVREDVKRGRELSVSLGSTAIFPTMVIQMISIGEESGALDAMVEKVADYYDEELDTVLTRLVALLEPILILGISIVVGGIVLAMVMPIFSMYKGVGK